MPPWVIVKLFLRAKSCSLGWNFWRSGLYFFLESWRSPASPTLDLRVASFPIKNESMCCVIRTWVSLEAIQMYSSATYPQTRGNLWYQTRLCSCFLLRVWNKSLGIKIYIWFAQIRIASQIFASCQQGNLPGVWQGEIWIRWTSESSWCFSIAVCHSCKSWYPLRKFKIQWTLRQSWIRIWQFCQHVIWKFWRKNVTSQFVKGI